MQLIRDLIRDDQGQDLIEYALLMAVLAFAAVGFASGIHWGIFSGRTVADATTASAEAGAP
jgi:Flp pilus assembly pilin Flp